MVLYIYYNKYHNKYVYTALDNDDHNGLLYKTCYHSLSYNFPLSDKSYSNPYY